MMRGENQTLRCHRQGFVYNGSDRARTTRPPANTFEITSLGRRLAGHIQRLVSKKQDDSLNFLASIHKKTYPLYNLTMYM